ncbi:MAG: hypothetical protein NTZ75_09350 [Euryarchaeota archaeon]|nr:hypothetical protein [Euryarchaeota archaeon]
MIRDYFQNICTNIGKQLDDFKTNIEELQESVKELVLYDALDGGRTTLTSKPFIEPKHDIPLFSIGLIHTLKVLGAKSCVIMIHTSYNRERGEKEFQRVLNFIKSGAELIKEYSIEYSIRCNCLCINEDYELIDVLRDAERQTREGIFNAYFLFDYNEEWFRKKKGFDILNKLPNINVHVRHTKFNFSGGWIPGKMRRSAFLYSQNGASFSNWENDELVAQVAIALLAKKFNEGEALNKVYSDDNEIQQRYIKREVNLFKKIIYLREHPKKLFIFGSSIGPYQIYY